MNKKNHDNQDKILDRDQSLLKSDDNHKRKNNESFIKPKMQAKIYLQQEK